MFFFCIGCSEELGGSELGLSGSDNYQSEDCVPAACFSIPIRFLIERHGLVLSVESLIQSVS